VGVLPDFMIKNEIGIEPYAPCVKRDNVVSFGQTSYGYDCRLGRKFKVFTNVFGAVVDPKRFDPKTFVDVEGDSCLIPPNSFALGESLEYFRIPRDILAVCLGKSTYARCGIVVNITPLEPEWEGKITIEISNTTPLPAVVYANEGIAQVIFFRAEQPCKVSYKDKKGRYDKQKGIVLPSVDGVRR
jgi:dCTP deaminase